MRVGFVLDDDVDSANGVQQGVRTLSRWLRRNGHHTFSFSGGNVRVDSAFPAKDEKEAAFDCKYHLARMGTVRFNGNRVSTPIWPLPITPDGLKSLQSCDVVHVQAPYGPFVGRRIISKLRPEVRVVASFHMAPTGGHVVSGNRLLSMALSGTLRRVDAYTCDSDVSATFMEKSWGFREAEIVPNPWDPSDYQLSRRGPRSEGDRIVVIFLGRLVERKGCIYFLKTMAGLPRRTRALLDIQVLGDGPLMSQLRNAAYKLGIQDEVLFAGQVSEHEKRDRLARADVAVFPSVGGESFGIVLLEAIASGCTVTGFGNPGYASVLQSVPDSLVPVGDLQGLIKLVQVLVSNRSMRERLYSRQRAAIEPCAIDAVAAQYLSIYERSSGAHLHRSVRRSGQSGLLRF